MNQPTPNFRDLCYLESGSAIQKLGLEAIRKSAVLEKLKAFDPLLAGTLPLDLFTPSSDLDILCFAPDLAAFRSLAQNEFSTFAKFRLYPCRLRNQDSIIVNFSFQNFDFEVFAQKIPVVEQMAYQHLVVEYRLLKLGGASFHESVRSLKLKGVKTEPAFAQLLNLKGDPYEALLHYRLPD